MKVSLIDGPFRGELEHPAIRPGSCLQLTVSGNPELYGKADQHDQLRHSAYLVLEDGTAAECARKPHNQT